MEPIAGANRAVGCACGFEARGPDEAELRGLLRAHVRMAHPELSFSDEQLRAWVASWQAEWRARLTRFAERR